MTTATEAMRVEIPATGMVVGSNPDRCEVAARPRNEQWPLRSDGTIVGLSSRVTFYHPSDADSHDEGVLIGIDQYDELRVWQANEKAGHIRIGVLRCGKLTTSILTPRRFTVRFIQS